MLFSWECAFHRHILFHVVAERLKKKSAVPIAEGVTVELQTEIMWSHLSQLRVLESEGGEVLLLLTMSSYYSD